MRTSRNSLCNYIMCRQIGHSIRYCCPSIRFYNSPVWNSIIFFWFLSLFFFIFFSLHLSFCVCHSNAFNYTTRYYGHIHAVYRPPRHHSICRCWFSFDFPPSSYSSSPSFSYSLFFTFSFFILSILFTSCYISMVRKGWSIVFFREENTDCCIRKHFKVRKRGRLYQAHTGQTLWWKKYDMASL